MKRILFIALFSLIATFSFGQFANTQTIGSPTTLFKSKGGLASDSSFILLNNYADTTAANFSVSKNYMGSFIRVGSVIWVRGSSLGNTTPNRWYEFARVGSTGTVSSISQGFGILSTPNPITTTGTVIVDTLAMSTKANVQKVKDSLVGIIALKLNISDTAAMLANRLKISDTLTMLAPYLRKSDTATMLAPFVQYSDTSNQMSGYLRKNFALLLQDTATAFSVRPLNNRFLDSISAIRTLANSKYTGGTVTSVATNNGTGITGGTITTTGTLAIDTTTIISTKLNVLNQLNKYTGSTNIVTLGTITTGVWNGTAIANANLQNSSITINGNSVSLGGSTTVTANTPNSITFNNGGAGGASGSTFNGGSALTVSYNTLGALATADTAAMKATITLDRVLQNGNTTGRTITADAFQGKVQTATTTTNANFSIGIFATNANQNQVVNVTNAATINPSTGAFGVGSGGISTSGNLTVSGFTYPQDVSLAKGVSFINGGQPSVIANSTAMYVERSGVTTDLIVRTDTSVSPFTLRKYLRFNNSTTNTYTFPNNTGTLALTTDTSFSTVTFDRVLANGNTTGRTFTAGGATLTGALNGTSGTFGVAKASTWSFSSDYARFGHSSHDASTNYGFLQRSNNQVFIEGSIIAMNLNGGNVGIGITSPSYKTVIAPSTSYTAINTGDGLQINGTPIIGTGSNMILAVSSSGSIIQSRDGVSTNSLLLNPYGGRLLVNTTTDDGSSIIQANGVIKTTASDNVLKVVSNSNVAGIKFTSTGGVSSLAQIANNLVLNNLGVDALTIASTGAATFSSSVTANSFIKSGGTSSEFLMADGSTSNLIWNRSSALISTNTAGDSLKLNATNGNANYIRTTSNGTFQVRDSSNGIVHLSSNSSQSYVYGDFQSQAGSITANSFINRVASVSTTYTVGSEGTVFASGNNYTITLPSASGGNTGRIIIIKRTSGGFGTPNIIISGVTLDSSENGGSLQCGAAAIYQSNGTNWYCISYHAGGCN